MTVLQCVFFFFFFFFFFFNFFEFNKNRNGDKFSRWTFSEITDVVFLFHFLNRHHHTTANAPTPSGTRLAQLCQDRCFVHDANMFARQWVKVHALWPKGQVRAVCTQRKPDWTSDHCHRCWERIERRREGREKERREEKRRGEEEKKREQEWQRRRKTLRV